MTDLDSLTCAVVGIETLVADSQTFRDKIGVPYDAEDITAHRAQALNSIHWFTHVLEDHLYSRPAAVVAFGGASLIEWGEGQKIVAGTATEMVLVLSAPSEAENDRPSAQKFLAFAGGVFDDVRRLSGGSYDNGAGNYYPLSGGRTIVEPRRTPLANRKSGVDYWLTIFGFENNWG